ncbi:MAG: hypothetical protein V3T05_14380 [Myxococcota bacterium]
MTAEPDYLYRRRSLLLSTAAVALFSLSTGAGGASGSLVVSPVKKSLILATEAGTKVELTLEPAALDTGTTLPRISLSVGTVGTVTRTGPGRFEVDYFIPDRKPPSVCILVARFDAADGPILGATVIKLFGQARVNIKTEKKAIVRLRVAGKLLGPFRANASGIVETSITVPPGVRSFQVLAVDAAGNRSTKKKILAVPPFPGVGFAPTPLELVADGKHETEIAIAAISPKGDLVPFRGKCKASPGKLRASGKSGQLSTWLFRSRRIGGGMTRIICRQPSPASAPGKLELALVAGPANSLSVAGPASAVAGNPALLELLVTDAAGNQVAALPELEITVDHGEIVAADDPEVGRTYTFVPPKKLPAAGVATLTIEAVGTSTSRPTLSAVATIELSPGPLDAIVVDTPKEELVATSGVDLEIRLHLVDAHGNPVPPPHPATVTAEYGEATWRGAGDKAAALVTYRSPRFPLAGTDHLEIRVGGVHSQVTVAMPYSPGRGYVSLRAGAMMLRNGWVAPAIGLDVSTSLPFAKDHLAVGIKMVGARAFRGTNLKVNDIKVGRVRQTIYLAPILLTVEARLPLTDTIDLSFGGGGGGLISWTKLDSRGDETQVPPDRVSRVLSPSVGAHIRAGFGFGSVGGVEVGLDGFWAQTHTANAYRGDLTSVSLTGGWRLGWKGAIW